MTACKAAWLSATFYLSRLSLHAHSQDFISYLLWSTCWHFTFHYKMYKIFHPSSPLQKVNTLYLSHHFTDALNPSSFSLPFLLGFHGNIACPPPHHALSSMLQSSGFIIHPLHQLHHSSNKIFQQYRG